MGPNWRITTPVTSTSSAAAAFVAPAVDSEAHRSPQAGERLSQFICSCNALSSPTPCDDAYSITQNHPCRPLLAPALAPRRSPPTWQASARSSCSSTASALGVPVEEEAWECSWILISCQLVNRLTSSQCLQASASASPLGQVFARAGAVHAGEGGGGGTWGLFDTPQQAEGC